MKLRLDDDAVREGLRLAGATDAWELSRLWYTLTPRPGGARMLPRLAWALGGMKAGRARACLIYRATFLARVDGRAVEPGLRALGDPVKEVRARACMLLAHSREREVAAPLRAVRPRPTRALALRAAADWDGFELEAHVRLVRPDQQPVAQIVAGQAGGVARVTSAMRALLEASHG